MKKRQASVDGFILRRPGSELGDFHENTADSSGRRFLSPSGNVVNSRTLHSGNNASTDRVGVPREGKELKNEEDIYETLNLIGSQEPEVLHDSTVRNDKKTKKHRRRISKKKLFKWLAIIILIVGLVAGGYVAYKAIKASGNVFNGSVLDVLTKTDPLQEDENGRSNFLIFGTAEDDEGGTHDGANLTDSIMVVSVDQDEKDAYMISLPRDLWVQYDEVCTVGHEGKINAVYFCASGNGEDEEAGAEALQSKVGEVLGLDIQYYIHVNFTAVVDVVDAVGGVDLTIEGYDPAYDGILDRNFDWKCNYECYYVNYKNGEEVHLDGEHALALARARNASGGYGLPNGNFDREKNQQKILKALREKALSVGTLTNISAVSSLLDAVGNNLRTNIETREIRTIMDIAANISDSNIVSLSLVEEDNMLVTTGSYGGQSIVRPVLGLLDYSDIQEYMATNLSSDPFVKEEPHVTVLNATETSGVAQDEALELEEMGFVVDEIDNAPEGDYNKIEIYQISAEKTATAEKLESLYGVEVKTSTPPVSVVGETDFVIIIGDASAVL